MIARFPHPASSPVPRPVPPPGLGPLRPGPLPIGMLTVVLGPAASGKTGLLGRLARDMADGESGARIILAAAPPVTVPSLRVFEALLLAHKQGGRWALGTEEIQAVDACLRQADLAHAAGLLVERLDAQARQRLLLALALVRKPDVILMDEPEGPPAASCQARIAALLKHAASELGIRAVIAMTDAAAALQVADRVLVLDHGRLVAKGTPAQLRQQVQAGDLDATLLSSA
ncbi:ABC transporter ATP-binding protein [Achromobacter xylosoxidans]|uniref:ABC transporter ATP-binding protein n=1 Tax=Alcaligenes xylosoxydans xylosoxydans TaxID=85698 RepID=UPI003CFC00B9